MKPEVPPVALPLPRCTVSWCFQALSEVTLGAPFKMVVTSLQAIANKLRDWVGESSQLASMPPISV
jgi:hypothetical protein